MRLIDAHKLYEQYETAMRELVKSTNCENISLEALSLLCGAKLIADAPTVDAAPVVHGRWEPVKNLEGMFKCSVCGDEWGSAAKMVPMQYCPSCSAKMDLEEQQDD